MISKTLALIALKMILYEIFAQNEPIDKCFEELGLTQSHMKNFIQSTDENDLIPELKCVGACVVETLHLVKDCKLEDEKALAKMEEIGARKDLTNNLTLAIDKCRDSMVSTDRCGCGYEALACLDKNIHGNT